MGRKQSEQNGAASIASGTKNRSHSSRKSLNSIHLPQISGNLVVADAFAFYHVSEVVDATFGVILTRMF